MQSTWMISMIEDQQTWWVLSVTKWQQKSKTALKEIFFPLIIINLNNSQSFREFLCLQFEICCFPPQKPN